MVFKYCLKESAMESVVIRKRVKIFDVVSHKPVNNSSCSGQCPADGGSIKIEVVSNLRYTQTTKIFHLNHLSLAWCQLLSNDFMKHFFCDSHSLFVCETAAHLTAYK